MNTPVKFYSYNGMVFDKEGKEVKPDNDGLISIQVDGFVKQFKRDAFAVWLTYNNRMPSKLLTKVKRKIGRRKVTNGHHRSKAIVAIKDGREIPFPSSAAAARTLKVYRTNIPHVLSGKYHHLGGYQFKYAQ